MSTKRRWHGIDGLVLELARRQHDVVSRGQLLELGLCPRSITRRIARGMLHPKYRGVYAVGRPQLTREGVWFAAVLAGGPGAVISHRAAAAAWRIGPIGAAPDITVPRSRRSRPNLRVYCAVLPPDEVTVVDGIPVTTVPRTLLDLAAVIGQRPLERAMNEAEVLRLGDTLSLDDLLERYPRRPGVVALRAAREATRAGATVTRSELEERFIERIDAAGLPRPRVNALVTAGERDIEVDCMWSGARLVVELDGHAAHGTRAAFEGDRARDRALQAAGWRVVRITHRQLHDTPAAVAVDLRALLGA